LFLFQRPEGTINVADYVDEILQYNNNDDDEGDKKQFVPEPEQTSDDFLARTRRLMNDYRTETATTSDDSDIENRDKQPTETKTTKEERHRGTIREMIDKG
jgi:hypothetical protein